jgi:hypothetical protein
MEPMKLPFWLSNGHLKKYADFLLVWFETVRGWLTFPLDVFDIDTTSLAIVDLFAWERDIQRVYSESETLYRKRVKYAYLNAKEAGTLQGFKNIWQRLELGGLVVHERIPGLEWDIIRLEIEDSTLADHPEILNVIIKKYGLTCRRYEWFSEYTLKMNNRAQQFENIEQIVLAKL